MNKIEVLREVKNPEVLVITPLLPGHTVSKATKKSIKRNDIPFTWITSTGNNNIPTNILKGIDWYKNPPDYYFPLDNDIVLGRGILDKLYRKLEGLPREFAYAYASFQFRGFKNFDFPADEYDIHRLLKHNYISSNSLFRTDVVKEIGLVTDDEYVRLLDWCFILKLFLDGYIGMPCPEANFIATTTEKDISMWTKKEYEFKRVKVLEKWGRAIVEKYDN